MNYREFVGPKDKYDLVGAVQFNILTKLGLREQHALLDIGCGSLRGGRLFIPYLKQRRYFGIEPENWLIEAGIINEIGRDMVAIKQPTFSNDNDFTLTTFGVKFNYILAQSIFSHAAPQQVTRCLSQSREVMHASSIFIATFKAGIRDYEGEEWVYPDVVMYTPDFMRRAARDNGLACVVYNWGHPNGQAWALFTDPQNVHAKGYNKVVSVPRQNGKPLEVFGGK